MADKIKAPRGTADILPDACLKWRHIESTARETAALFGFGEVRFPTFEHTELFERGVGDGTDVVQKEMYTFLDKGNRSVTLRPEGTASVARLFLEHSLYGGAMPVKYYYLSSCFRYEKPQAGRLREFHQFGAELLGAPAPAADAEIISLAHLFFRRLGLSGIRLEISSIGCPLCRAPYMLILKDYFSDCEKNLCPTCRERLLKNPLRLLDCKEKGCAAVISGAPLPVNHLCGECGGHFDGVKARLDALGIDFTVNGRIVRGLDYYTRTVFEFISDDIGAQGTVCGGGRYDGLMEELGGPPLPAIGFALGLERLLLLMDAAGAPFPDEKPCDIYIAGIGERAHIKAQALAGALRAAGLRAECDALGRSLKAQMKYADKLGARFTAVIGDDELSQGKAALRDMDSGQSVSVSICDFEKELIRMINT